MIDALRAAEVLAPSPVGTDSRLRWMLAGFVSLLLTFATAACCFRVLHRRQLRRIDELANEA